jgi:hypothetical protein
MQRGIATFTLDYGKCPAWLFQRMVNLGREMAQVIVAEYGPEEFIRRIADPVWFQSLGTVLAFDWNASGLTTILTAALKEALKNEERQLGIFICGGKGKTSRKTPEQIETWGQNLNFEKEKTSNLVYNSKMAAKVDSSLVQDGFQIYHHSFFFTKTGAWTVVQQGMNTASQTARRYHWFSEKIEDLVCEPHAGISSDQKTPTLNLVAKESSKARQLSAELVQNGYAGVMKDIKILRKHSSSLHKMTAIKTNENQLTLLHLENKEFVWHPVAIEDFSKSRYLDKILYQVCDYKPGNYESLLSLPGVGPKTIRALALVSEVIYGAKPSYEDPARYSFAHGGKDATPYPVDCQTYDSTIKTMKKVVEKTKINVLEKKKIISRLDSKLKTKTNF